MHSIPVAECLYFIQKLEKFMAPRSHIFFKIPCNNQNQDTDEE